MTDDLREALERLKQFAGWCRKANACDDESFSDYISGHDHGIAADIGRLAAAVAAVPEESGAQLPEKPVFEFYEPLQDKGLTHGAELSDFSGKLAAAPVGQEGEGFRASQDLERALKPFADLYDQIIADHGLDWFADEGQVMRAALAYPVANSAVVWRHFRLASEAIARLADHPVGQGDGRIDAEPSGKLRADVQRIIDFTIADARLHDALEELSHESTDGIMDLLRGAI